MIWRAQYSGGGNPPPSPEPGDEGDYVPTPTGAKHSVNLYGLSSGKVYRVDIRDPLRVGEPCKQIVRTGATTYEMADGSLWRDMWRGSNASPPCRGSLCMPASDFTPPGLDGKVPYNWRNVWGIPAGYDVESATAAAFSEDYHAISAHGTNLMDVILAEARWLAENSTWYVGYSKDFYLRFKPTMDLPALSVNLSTVYAELYSTDPKLPDGYTTGPSGYKQWTRAGISDPAVWRSISFGLTTVLQGLLYNGYSDDPGNVGASATGTRYNPGVSGFSRYPKPELYLQALPPIGDVSVPLTISTYAPNNCNRRGGLSSQWPTIGGNGFDPSYFGVALMDGIPGGKSVIQYRHPTWAVVRR